MYIQIRFRDRNACRSLTLWLIAKQFGKSVKKNPKLSCSGRLESRTHRPLASGISRIYSVCIEILWNSTGPSLCDTA
jgi:hypothetical protein